MIATLLVLPACAAPRIEIDVESTACKPGCAITSYELRLLSASGCAMRSARSPDAMAITIADSGLRDGDGYAIEVHGFCADDACARCVGTATAVATEGAHLRVELVTTTRCALSTHPPCEVTRLWLGSGSARLDGSMKREEGSPGSLAGSPLYPDGDGVTAVTTRALELAVSDDAYVVAGQYANDARGLDPKLVVTTPHRLVEPQDFDYLREALLRVPLGIHDPATTARAEVLLYTIYGTTYPGPHDAHFELAAAASDAWSEKTVTWNNAPAASVRLASSLVVHLDWTALDATSLVLAEQLGDGVASFRVRSDREGYISAGSRETVTKPVLRLHQARAVTPVDTATFELETRLPGAYYLWGRLLYPGTTSYPERDPNRFWVLVDELPPRLLGGRSDRDRTWHWDGMRGKPLPIGFLEAGRHRLRIVKHAARESGSARRSPRLDVILVTNDPTYTPSDPDVRL